MFLAKKDFMYSIRVIEICEGLGFEEIKITIANDLAKELFEDFDAMEKDEKEDVIDMIIDDMSLGLYTIH
jgi:hypothetical protein